jgi:hypothetical protein
MQPGQIREFHLDVIESADLKLTRLGGAVQAFTGGS